MLSSILKRRLQSVLSFLLQTRQELLRSLPRLVCAKLFNREPISTDICSGMYSHSSPWQLFTWMLGG